MIECPELYTVSISLSCTDMRGSCSIYIYIYTLENSVHIKTIYNDFSLFDPQAQR